MNEKISVIVAVYNTEKYLKKCIESLLSQSYKNMEIIIVEDCSKDNSRQVLESYKNNPKIKIFYNQKNSGLSYSRNRGLKEATGSYIGYIDSDDYVDNDFYEKLMTSIKENKSDIAVCDMKIVYENNNTEVISKCCNEDEFSVYNVVNNGLAASACNKLFKKSIISKYQFAEGKVNEDIAVVIPALVEAKKISYANTYYYYVQRNNSIQNSGFSDKRFDIFYGIETTLERIKHHALYEKLADTLIYNQLIVLLLYVIPKEKNFWQRYKILKKYNNLIKKYNSKKNKEYLKFLNGQSKINRIYYATLVNLNDKKLILLDNLWISFYHLLRDLKKIKQHQIIPNLTIEDIKKRALKQSTYKEPEITVSVIIPNYNYSRYLYQRVYSILAQNYKIKELIILDDCSTDDSVNVIKEIEKAVKDYIDIKVVINKQNSGNAFSQWQKGFSLANGDYVWICEADDYCQKDFLKKVINPVIKYNDIVISYANTGFISAEGQILKNSLIDQIDLLKTKHWNKNYVNDGKSEITNYSYLNCTIPNVSGIIIKNKNYDEILKISKTFKQCGDWYFYLNVLEQGKIAFYKKTLNYYRLHGNNISSTMNKKNHLLEIKKIYSYLGQNNDLSKEQKENMNQRLKFLIEVWGIKENEN